MKGIILAGGQGTRLRPATLVTNKHLLPIIDKPMIEYPIATLMDFGCEDILIVSGGNHIGAFAEYLGDGSQYKTIEDGPVKFTYKVQKEAGGIAQALGLAEDFAQGEDVLVILGDNIFDNESFKDQGHFVKNTATIYVKNVEDPKRFGVVKFKEGTYDPEAIVEKPEDPPSAYAVTGLYHFPADVFEYIKTLQPSDRGELEITDVNNWYLKQERLEVRKVSDFWSDAGTPQSMVEVVKWASQYGG